MYKKILVPTDGSAYANQEIKRAEKLINKNGEIIILSVVKQLNTTHFDNKKKIKEFNEKMHQEAKDNVENMKKKFDKSLNIKCKVITGYPAETINKVADEENVDLIIIASSGQEGLHKFLIGSVAREVMKHASKDVLLIPIK